MSNGVIELKEIGVQKIHEQTHIALQHIQAILHESFEDLTKVQLAGFISILEREYDVDLDDLKQKGTEYYSQNSSSKKQEKKVFVTPKKKESHTLIYLFIVAIIFVVAIVFSMNSSSRVKTDVLDNQAIEDAKDNIKIAESDVVFEDENVSTDENTSIDENTTADENFTNIELNVSTTEIVEPELVSVKSFKIIANVKLWLGYMDLETRQKKQKIFTGELDLDPTKDWLLTLGHGYVNVSIDGNITEFKSKYNLKLLYKDTNMKKISFAEFKALNKGTKW